MPKKKPAKRKSNPENDEQDADEAPAPKAKAKAKAKVRPVAKKSSIEYVPLGSAPYGVVPPFDVDCRWGLSRN